MTGTLADRAFEGGPVEADARGILREGRMGLRQILAVALCVLLNGLDGFDVLSISFASPGIAREWGIDRAALGVVLSMELLGMAAGSLLLGRLADRIGRRPTIIGSLVTMAVGMALAGITNGVVSLAVYRFATGLGIGGVLATTAAIVAEISSTRRRDLAVALMSSGYPVGAVLGGMIAAALLVAHDWRTVFLFGSVATGLCVPLAFALIPESIDFIAARGRPDALARVNRILALFGHPSAAYLEAPAQEQAVRERLWTRALAPITALLTVGYFAHIMTFYFLVKWIPKIVSDMGYAASSAGGVLVWANVGGAVGALTFSTLILRLDVRRLTIATLVLSSLGIALFGRGVTDLATLSMLAALAACCSNAGIIGFYTLLARSYPPSLRASGVGFVIGAGRGGAALGPIIAGLLFSAGWNLSAVALAMALGSLLSAGALVALGQLRRA